MLEIVSALYKNSEIPKADRLRAKLGSSGAGKEKTGYYYAFVKSFSPAF